MAKQCIETLSFAEPAVPFWQQLLDRATKAALVLLRWQRDYYELRMFLETKDDRLLRDMGVDRYDLRQELRRPFWDWARRDS